MDGVFDDFPKISEDSLKLVRRSHEHFPRNSEDCQRLLKKTRRCVDHLSPHRAPLGHLIYTEYQLYTSAANLIAVKSSISSTVGILKIRHWSPGCGFVWIPKVVYFPIKHSSVYVLDKFIEEIYNPFLSFFIYFLEKYFNSLINGWAVDQWNDDKSKPIARLIQRRILKTIFRLARQALAFFR